MPPTLSEAETALVENFLQDILSIFPLVGLGVFEKTESIKKPADLLTDKDGKTLNQNQAEAMEEKAHEGGDQDTAPRASH